MGVTAIDAHNSLRAFVMLMHSGYREFKLI